ncbi:hypothetical protein FACS189467_0390 [Bacteroidia bacterium]|nr:hypothetical protein FACS189467_0390 [Bacteroidia bacterium]
MAILSFQKPDKVIMIESTSTVGKFEFRPLEPGYAMTIGNALRRVLLSGLEGYAITSVKISGVDHEFASIKGVVEDMIAIILNLKQVRLKRLNDTDSEKLVLDIVTDGSIAPLDALKEAAKILIHHFVLFTDEKMTKETEKNPTNEDFDEELLRMRQLLKTRLIDLELSVRALNCLKTAEVETLGELVKYQRNDLLKFRNFGRKSLVELDEKLVQLNLNFGMDITPYKLDKDI